METLGQLMMEVPKNDGQCDGLKSLNADEAHRAFIFRPIECVTRHPGMLNDRWGEPVVRRRLSDSEKSLGAGPRLSSADMDGFCLPIARIFSKKRLRQA